jgi:hypothetical protein
MQEHSLKDKLTSAFWAVAWMTFASGLFFSGMAQPGTSAPIGWVLGWAIGLVVSTAAIAACILLAPKLSVGGHKEYFLHALTGLAVGVVAVLLFVGPSEGLALAFSTSFWPLKVGIILLGSFAGCDYHIQLTKTPR